MPVPKPRYPELLAVSLLVLALIVGSDDPGQAQEERPEKAPDGVLVSPPSEVQEKVREWVRVKKQISAERADWEAERQSLADLNELRKEEIAQLDEFIGAAGSRLADAEARRDELLTEEESLRGKRQLLLAEIDRAETALRAISPHFPPPLREKVDEALGRIETPAPDAPLQDRYRDLVTVLGEAGAFHGTLTIDTELREIGGERVEVDVLYLGLSRAWYVDRGGSHAGTGIPTSEGWQWTEDPSVASQVRQAIAIRRKEAAPSIVPLPFPAQSDLAEK